MTHEQNRRAALHYVGRVFEGTRMTAPEVLDAAFEWALSKLEPEPSGGRVEALDPAKYPPETRFRLPAEDEDPNQLQLAVPVPPPLRRKLDRLAEVAARVRPIVQDQLPPRNVPEPGDGSTTPPIYRFYCEQIPAQYETFDVGTVEGERKLTVPPQIRLWREDTRNVRLRWSLWEPEMGRWVAQVQPGRPVDRANRINTEQLASYGAAVETRHDIEEEV